MRTVLDEGAVDFERDFLPLQGDAFHHRRSHADGLRDADPVRAGRSDGYYERKRRQRSRIAGWAVLLITLMVRGAWCREVGAARRVAVVA